MATTDRIFTFVTAPGKLARFVRTKIAPFVTPFVYGFEVVRETIFRMGSQIMLNYRDSPLSAGSAGAVRGGDRLPWVRTGSGDNYCFFNAIGWQIHVYGEADVALSRWCETNEIPLHIFDWGAHLEDAGLSRSAAYLLRPDTYVAMATASADIAEIGEYLNSRGLNASPR